MRYKQNKIVYLSHGNQKFYVQTHFSVLSLLDLMQREQYDDCDIVVYTDQPQQVLRHPRVHPIKLDAAALHDWRGPLDYVHRIKLEALRRATCEIGLPFIYVDGDTRWLNIPRAPFSALAQQTTDDKPPFYMHLCEGEITTQFFPMYFRFLTRSFAQFTRFDITKNPPWLMWNAGVIGVPGHADGFFQDVLALNDRILPFVRTRNYVEQLALSLVASSRCQVRTFEHWLHHYWPVNNEATVLIRQHFGLPSGGMSLNQQLHLYHTFEWDEAAMRKIQNSPDQRRANWQAKMRNSLYKRKIDLKAFWLRLSLNRDDKDDFP